VVSAEEMYDACHQYFDKVDVAIAAAAVADYKPKHIATQKIKKAPDNFVIELEKTKDILASLGIIKKNQFLIGFALETENEIENAKAKIQKKNLDLIVLNSLQDKGAGFGKPTNKVTFIDKDFNIEPMELKSKEAVADDILNKVIAHFHE
jgi:phosphopantothenoylcysteine decarboxylase/phosphopantothenate--cysteine ligase